jgi:methionyl aminopeptidase
MEKIPVRSKEEIKIIIDGGKRLAEIKKSLEENVKVGVNAWEIEKLASKLIKKSGGEPSFTRVSGYHWATCINVNEGIVHGIPRKDMVFRAGDVVSVDVGLYYKEFNTDTSFSKGLDIDRDTQKFLDVGKLALDNAIAMAVPGGRIFDISKAIEDTLKDATFNPVRVLVGHGVGRDLHEYPEVPQFVMTEREKTPEIPVNSVLAIEVIYTKGSGGIKYGKDGWTIITSDGKISALYEDTVIVTENDHLIATR